MQSLHTAQQQSRHCDEDAAACAVESCGERDEEAGDTGIDTVFRFTRVEHFRYSHGPVEQNFIKDGRVVEVTWSLAAVSPQVQKHSDYVGMSSSA